MKRGFRASSSRAVRSSLIAVLRTESVTNWCPHTSSSNALVVRSEPGCRARAHSTAKGVGARATGAPSRSKRALASSSSNWSKRSRTEFERADDRAWSVRSGTWTPTGFENVRARQTTTRSWHERTALRTRRPEELFQHKLAAGGANAMKRLSPTRKCRHNDVDLNVVASFWVRPFATRCNRRKWPTRQALRKSECFFNSFRGLRQRSTSRVRPIEPSSPKSKQANSQWELPRSRTRPRRSGDSLCRRSVRPHGAPNG